MPLGTFMKMRVFSCMNFRLLEGLLMLLLELLHYWYLHLLSKVLSQSDIAVKRQKA